MRTRKAANTDDNSKERRASFHFVLWVVGGCLALLTVGYVAERSVGHARVHHQAFNVFTNARDEAVLVEDVTDEIDLAGNVKHLEEMLRIKDEQIEKLEKLAQEARERAEADLLRATPPPKKVARRQASLRNLRKNLRKTQVLTQVAADEQDQSVLPDFWVPSKGVASLEEVGYDIDGEPSILISIASYRDELCDDTIANAFQRAKFKSRIIFGVVQQNADGDQPCVPLACENGTEWRGDVDGIVPVERTDKAICERRNQIRLHKAEAKDSVGPVWARHIGNRLYAGESFVLQVDAHITFVNDWDVTLVNQWRSTGNERAVLTTYPQEVVGAIDENGDRVGSRSKNPVMCNFTFVGNKHVVRHSSAFEIDVKSVFQRHAKTGTRRVTATPILHPFWAAGFSFSRGHFGMRVPNDPHMTMMFQGEEIDIAVRAWTRGYDFYSPPLSVLFHPYARPVSKRPHMFWENGGRHAGAGDRAAQRLRALLRCDNPAKPGTNVKEWAKYGLGTERPVEWFYFLFGMDCVRAQRTKELCKSVWNGEMHFGYTPYLRADKFGIDYSKVPEIVTFEARPGRQAGENEYAMSEEELEQVNYDNAEQEQ